MSISFKIEEKNDVITLISMHAYAISMQWYLAQCWNKIRFLNIDFLENVCDNARFFDYFWISRHRWSVSIFA